MVNNLLGSKKLRQSSIIACNFMSGEVYSVEICNIVKLEAKIVELIALLFGIRQYILSISQ